MHITTGCRASWLGIAVITLLNIGSAANSPDPFVQTRLPILGNAALATQQTVELPVHNLTKNLWYSTIQEAVDAADSGNEIVLSPGTYTGTGNRDIDNRGKSLTIRGTDPQDADTVASTIIDCQASVSDLHRAFSLQTDESCSVSISGITITNGFALNETVDAYPAAAGGAIFCRGVSLTLDHCVLSANSSLSVTNYTDMSAYGGAVYCDSPALTVTYCTIAGNRCGHSPTYAYNTASNYGGGIYAVVGQGILIEDSIITDNVADPGWHLGGGHGGGLRLTGPATITRCQVSRNLANDSNDPGFGGGMSCGGPIHISDCTITDNIASQGNSIPTCGGGIACGTGIIENCQILRNGHGGAIGAGICGGSVIRNCIIADNTMGSEGNPFGGGVAYAGLVENCLIVGNKSYGPGGGLAKCREVRNCTIIGNTAQGETASAAYMCDLIANSIILGNVGSIGSGFYTPQISGSTSVTYSSIQDWAEGGEGNFWDDPLFAVVDRGTWTAPRIGGSWQSTLTDASKTWTPGALAGKTINLDLLHKVQCFITANTATTLTVLGDCSKAVLGSAYEIYDYRLRSCSPCVNAGDPTGDHTGQTDIDGQPRVQLGRVDIGASEFDPASNPAVPGAPLHPRATPSTLCPGGCATLSADLCDGADVLEWFTDACGGTPVSGGASPQVCPGSTTTYYARAGNSATGKTSSCVSAALTVRVPGLWQPLNDCLNASGYALINYGGKLILGGDFDEINGSRIVGIAAWNGSSWHQLGSGLKDDSTVYAMCLHNGKLIVGGKLSVSGEAAVHVIASWNGSAWEPLGNGPGLWVLALTSFRGDLIAGTGLASFKDLKLWNGSVWESIAGDLNKRVLALTIYQDQLIAAGSFTTIGNVAANYIASWDGISWKPLGSGTNGSVSALAVYNDELFVGGSFTTAGDVDTPYIARWNGSQWQAVGGGFNNSVLALTVYGQLIAGGSFTTADGAPANYVARWTGSAWLPLDTGRSDSVGELGVYNGELFAAHNLSPGIASWGCCVPPDISLSPSPLSAVAGGTATLTVGITGSEPLSYQWRKDDISLTDDERITGSTTTSLTITPAIMHDAGDYYVVVSNPCGSVTSQIVTLHIDCPAWCPADLDRDCDVDQGDLTIYETCALGPNIPYNPAALPAGCTLDPDAQGIIAADYDRDGDVDQADFGVLQRCYSEANMPADPDCDR